MWSGMRYHLVISGMGCSERGIWDLVGFGVGFKKRQSSGMGCNEMLRSGMGVVRI